MMEKQVNVGVIGAGRIGKLHIEHLAKSISNANLVAVADVNMNAELSDWVKGLGAEAYQNPDKIFADPQIEAVVICSSTNTHVDLMIRAAKAGKDIFLEKPIDFEIQRALEGIRAVQEAGVKIQLGYVRRFDHNFKAVQETVASGKLGKPHIIKITTRDAAPPPFEYAKVSGGIFLDMSIHDFDMARFLSGSEVAEVSAYGQVMMDPQLEEIGDVDVATTMLKMENGVLCIVDNVRKSGYGYDLRSEVECENGCAQMYNDTNSTMVVSTMEGIISEKPKWFFLERFQEAFLVELQSFVDDIQNDRQPAVGVKEGLMSMAIAKAAKKSLQEGRSVKMSEFQF